jgi:hypothetical protein
MDRRAVFVLAVGAVACCACSLLQKPAPADAGPPDVEVAASATTEEAPLPALEGGAPVPRGRPSSPVHPHAGAGCAGNLVPVVPAGAAGAECVLECASDAACPEGTICDAKGALDEGGKPGKTVSYCGVGKRAAGKADAGAPAPPLNTPVAPNTPAKHLDVRKGANGACPAGYLACGAACRLSCKAASDCEVTGARCVSAMCEGPGALPCK